MVIGEEPSRPSAGVTLDNWQVAPQLAWSFQHVEELFSTAVIARGGGPVAALAPAGRPAAGGHQDALAVVVPLADGSVTTVGDLMARTETDGWVVWRGGRILAEGYPRGMAPDTRHLLMSVSKSLVGLATGALVGQGALDPERLVTDYVPDLADSGYAGATVRHLLDMRSGVAFSEDYLDPDAEVRVLEQAMGMAPRRHPLVPATLKDFLVTLRQGSAHGGPFDYRSGETDVLGWVLEGAAGSPLPELLSRVLWSRIGAEEDAAVIVDRNGAAMADGGVCAALRDLARVGVLLVQDGTSLTGEQVVPASWVADTLAGGPDSRQAFEASLPMTLMPGGMYRNQLWFPYPGNDVVLALGIHGQMVYVHRPTGTVAAKVSCWPEPQHAWKLFSTLRAFDALAVTL